MYSFNVFLNCILNGIFSYRFVMGRVFLSVLFFCNCSCSLITDDEKEEDSTSLKEVPTLSKSVIEAPEIVLFENGKRFFKAGLYSLAMDNFRSLKDSYPDGPYTEFAKLKIGDCLYSIGEYLQAYQHYLSFIEANPTSKYLDYARYKASQSILQESSDSVGKDISPANKALELVDKFIDIHQDSPYLYGAKRYRSVALKKIRDYERYVAKFYDKKNIDTASSKRFTIYRKLKAKVALAKKALGIDKLFSKISENKKELPKLLYARSFYDVDISKSNNLKISKNIANATESYKTPDKEDLFLKNVNPENTVFITDIQCIESIINDREINDKTTVRNQRMVSVTLTKPIPYRELPEEVLVSQNRSISYAVPNAAATPQTLSCFNINDIIVSSTGVISFNQIKLVRVLSLIEPDRLIFFVK